MRIDPRYIFNFVGPEGKKYHRQIYWERLYAFFPNQDTVLAVARIVPHHNMHYALFQALRGKGKGIHQALLPEASRGRETTDFISSVTEMIHYRTPSPPAKVVADAREGLGETFEQVMVEYGMRNWLDYVPEPGGASPIQNVFSPPTAILDLLAGITEEDAGWFRLSYKVDAFLKEQIQHMEGNFEGNLKKNALVRRRDLEDDIYRRLYSNPKYLELVKRVMDAKGGYASPVVSHFLSFYSRYLNQKMEEYTRQKNVDTAFLRKRLQGILGKTEAESLHILPAHKITVLGYVRKGELSPNEKDPENTGKSYQVDPDAGLRKIVLKEVEDKLSRAFIKGFVRYIFGKTHYIKGIGYIDDPER